jgi:cellobiose phosphorylase
MPWRAPRVFDRTADEDELPLRGELYNIEQLAQHAASLAESHQLATGRGRDRLLARLNENQRVLVETYDMVAAAVGKSRRIVPAAEWLLDNFYVIEEQIRIAHRHLPAAYSRELPWLASGSTANYPRVYGIAVELVSHVDGRVDAASVGRFIEAYQTVAPLKLGELWAVPIMLRMALIENLRRVAVRIRIGRHDRDIAAEWAEKMLAVVERNPTDLVLVLADMARAEIVLSGAFLAELTRHLQGQSPHFAFANNWLEHRLSEQGQTVERLVQSEGQSQAADQVSIGNSISSLRLLSSIDWKQFVETQSVVESTLRDDPAGVYAKMDFGTRDTYRHEVESIAKRSRLSERDVALQAIQLAKDHAGGDDGDRAGHVGYYLIGRGRFALQRLAKVRWTAQSAVSGLIRRLPLTIYLGSILLITAASAAWLLNYPLQKQAIGRIGMCFLAAVILFCAGQLAIGIVNALAAALVKPRALPRLAFREGIPAAHRSMVVVPTMLSSSVGVETLVDDLEVRYLSNRDRNLHFALLTDFEDAPQETMASDEELLRLASEKIVQLNDKFRADRSDVFFLLHRPRKWNAREGVWMGYERKRGKLADLNALLRGRGENRFSHIVGPISILRDVRYVITLDADTQLPRNSAREMAGAMAHPLNRPVFDSKRGRVVWGHGILQPRIGVTLPSAQRSWFVRLFAGDAGIDPYTRTVSDVYQDLFGEGSFIGKGIYEVDAFEQASREFPENTILSHDLLEGVYARSAILSDVELYEEYPARYLADVGRRHRWVRGDWQIAAWLLPWVPALTGGRVRNSISALSWWKIFDNLRRSLVPAMLVVLFIGSWLMHVPAGMLFGVAVMAAAPLMAVLASALRKPSDLSLVAHLRINGVALAKPLFQFLFTLAVLPYEAYSDLDAIVRTLWRILGTKRNMLEWRTSSDAAGVGRDSWFRMLGAMWPAPATAVVVLLLLATFQPRSLGMASAVLALWFVSPAIAWRLSCPIAPPTVHLTYNQKIFLGKLARRTWRFFEVFVTPEENWLPPDNIQQHPAQVIASRTSPTNIGLALLANLSAYDFGYCSARVLLERTTKTIATMQRMERFRGHFFNWYDTRSLQPLSPQYISSVDSGNLAGHLMVLSQGLLELIDADILPPRVFGGLGDTAAVLLDVARRAAPSGAVRRIEAIQSEAIEPPKVVREAIAKLQALASAASGILGEITAEGELKWWARALEQSCADQLDDLNHLAAWSALPAPPEQLSQVKELHDLLWQLDSPMTLRAVAGLRESFVPAFDAMVRKLDGQITQKEWCESLREAVAQSSRLALERIAAIQQTAIQCQELAEMDVSFLYDKSRKLFSIGYNVRDHRQDAGFYDLLASEARLGSYVAIAQDQVDGEHWFSLGRLLTSAGGRVALLSWSGSMFEYLMPMLVMPTYENTLLDQTCKAAVRRQIRYGRQRGVPWGISESGYNTIDQNMNYQYRAFGVPGLGLKRGLAEDLVVAPYASAMALMVEPEAACKNLQRLDDDGQIAAYGVYEAFDFTPSRLPPATRSVTVRQFMSHHEGMSLLSIAYALLDKPMQRRFTADPLLRAADLLLHERVPKVTAPVFPHSLEVSTTRATSAEEQGTIRVLTNPAGPAPEVHLLSNGQYHVVITSAGGGYSRWRDLAVTRWNEDATRDCWGTFCYLRDVDTGAFWSTAWQPTLTPTKGYEAIFTQARAEFRRRDEEIEVHTEISVSPEDDIELRRISLTNRSEYVRTIEVTSYCEVVLASQAQDLSHPAFSNLFVQTELVRPRNAILCTRRPRSAAEHPPWMVHLMAVRAPSAGEASFETDRMKFLGRHGTPVSPAAMERPGPLSDSEGPVLDPVASIRQLVRLKPHESVRVDLVTGVGETRQAVTTLMDKYQDPNLADRVFELAWTHSQILLRQINATEADAQIYGRLAGSVIYASSLRRAKASILARNRRGQSGLWGYGISGDLPIVLVRIGDTERLDLVRQSVQAHAYWRMKGLIVDLVIWNEDNSVYRQPLQDAITGIVVASQQAALADKPGGVFVRRGEQMSEEDRVLLQTAARVVLFDEAGSLAEQVDRRGRSELAIPAFRALRRRVEMPTGVEAPHRDLAMYNGMGGFSRDGKEYITILDGNRTTPAPWVNVIANPEFGTVVSEGGSGYTWWQNSHEYRLTPWSDDPVSDSSGEAIYIRDEDTGRFFSPSPLPARGGMPYVIRHGFGYSVYEYQEDGVSTDLTNYVAIDAPVKFAHLRITNRSGRPRRLSVTAYWEWVLGDSRSKTLMHVVSELDPVGGALFARNPYSAEFADGVVFVESSEASRTITTDRTEFLGRNGSVTNPAAMRRSRLSGRTGAGLDPCAAMQMQVTLEQGQSKEIVLILGAAHSEEQARQLCNRYRGVSAARRELQRVWDYWNRTLGAVQIETPDTALNYLANGWLVYQILSARMWARTGFYQSGGAFGFRDQLQDAMALVHAEPRLFREHLLRAAARQFREGDVQHWWHPPSGRGVRTHISDDYLWLPYAVCRYVAATGDTGVLDERIPFLTGRPVRPEEDSYYDLPQVSDDVGTLYDHCLRAIDHGQRYGVHGLPLMGCGDWNDGMNLVGELGKGESVWLAFFLYDVLKQFSRLAEKRGEAALVSRYTSEAERIRQSIETQSWDGQWYRRAYFDNGEPLGSASNTECQIDSIPQSWAVFSGAGERERSSTAMENVLKRLVRRDERLIKLLDPPFDASDLNPGYIKGYVPGVRENGGQYTHAAIWTVMAFAAMGDSNRAWELFALINPVLHGSTAEAIATYRVEPYIVAADVYAVPPHTGRGGWTWYTGSAGWMYRLITESLLGLRLEVDKLYFSPRPHPDWKSFNIHYRYRETVYHITLQSTGKGTDVQRVVIDSKDSPDKYLPLTDDRTEHAVRVDLG